MGQEAEVKDKIDAVEPPADDETVATVETPEGEGSEGDGQGTQEPEVEIVREGETLPQEKEVPAGFFKRINKLNGKVDKAVGEASEQKARADKLQEENVIYKAHFDRLQSQEAPQPVAIPNPDDFPSGTYDPGYLSKVQEYNDRRTQERIDEGITKATETFQQTRSQQVQAHDLEQAQLAHCKKSAELGVKDYEEMEEVAISILGNETANQLIQVVDRSDLLFYYFGKNRGVAEKYADMLKTKPGKALTEIGGLLSEIKVKPKIETPPDPDDELEGGAPSNMEHLQSKLNKLREAARSGSSEAMKKVLAFKKEHAGKGIK